MNRKLGVMAVGRWPRQHDLMAGGRHAFLGYAHQRRSTSGFERTFFDGPSHNTRAFGEQSGPNKNNFEANSDGEDEGEDNLEATNDGQKYKSGDDGDDEDGEIADMADALNVAEEILADFPVGNVSRPRCTTPVPKPQKVPTGNISVRSSPSPSVSLASVLDSSGIDLRDRFPIYIALSSLWKCCTPVDQGCSPQAAHYTAPRGARLQW